MPVEEDIAPVLDRIRERRGVDFTQYRENTLRRRLSRRLLACSCKDLHSYINFLESRPEEYDRRLSDLTIKYTEFFRDPEVFDIIQGDVLPAVLERSAERDYGTAIWSAGCATGEEAYSLAVLLCQKQCTGTGFLGPRIIATDLDPVAIAAAQAGSYNADFALGQLPREAVPYFHREGRKLVASSQLKELISFRMHDLTVPSALRDIEGIWSHSLGLILCRNVLMYLTRLTQTKILELFAGKLEPGGYLVIGTKEAVPGILMDRLVPVNQKAGIYKKAW